MSLPGSLSAVPAGIFVVMMLNLNVDESEEKCGSGFQFDLVACEDCIENEKSRLWKDEACYREQRVELAIAVLRYDTEY